VEPLAARRHAPLLPLPPRRDRHRAPRSWRRRQSKPLPSLASPLASFPAVLASLPKRECPLLRQVHGEPIGSPFAHQIQAPLSASRRRHPAPTCIRATMLHTLRNVLRSACPADCPMEGHSRCALRQPGESPPGKLPVRFRRKAVRSDAGFRCGAPSCPSLCRGEPTAHCRRMRKE
jgi:hypothetical protein